VANRARPRRALGHARAGTRAVRSAQGIDRGRTRRDRDRILLRVDTRRNGGPTEATARDDQDTYSLRPGQVARRADEWEGGIVTSPSSRSSCMHVESVCTYALHSLPADEAIALEVHLTACAECRRELKSFQPVIDSLVGWPTDILRPTPQLWG